MRRRVEKVLSDLVVPIEEQVSFSVKYFKQGQVPTPTEPQTDT